MIYARNPLDHKQKFMPAPTPLPKVPEKLMVRKIAAAVVVALP